MDAILQKYMIDEPCSSEHFSNPENRRCLGPAAITAYSHLLRSRCHDFHSLYLSVENFLDVVKSEARTHINGGSLVRADQCLTIAISAVSQLSPLQDLLLTQMSDVFLMRSCVRADQRKRIEAVSDSAHAIAVDPANIEAHFHLSKCLADIEKRAHSVQVLFFALSQPAIPGSMHFVRLANAIAIGMAKLKDDEIDLRPLPSRLCWLHDAPTWQTIVKELAQKEEYNALGVVTIGTCNNMRTCQSPNIVIIKAADIPGVNYKFLDIGKMLKSICAQGIHRWHLQMAEFMIKRGAVVGTISEAFNQPLLVIMATLTMSGDMPSFFNLGLSEVPVMDLDEQDKDGNTAFHILLKGFDKRKSKIVEILCRQLLSRGAITSIRDSSGKMAEEYISKTERLYKILSEAATVSWPELHQRVELIRKLAKDKMDASEFDRAIEMYEKGLSICQNFKDVDMIQEKLKLLTNLSIANDKKGNFCQSLKHAKESISIHDSYWKGHYWVGVSYSKLGDPVKASQHFFLSLEMTDSEAMKNTITFKIVELLPQLIDSHTADIWLTLMVNTEDEKWSSMLEKMTTNKLWKALQILVLGPPFSDEGQGHCWGRATSKAQLQTIFEVLDDSSIHADRLILALLQHGADIKTITSCPENVLHEVVRFCALTNDTSVLTYVLGKRKQNGLEFCPNAKGQTPLHNLCYMSGKRVTMDTKVKLARILCDSGLDPKLKDGAGKTALDYAPENSLLKQFLERLSVTGLKDTTKGNLTENTKWKDLKEQGNQVFKAGKYHEAAELYSDALKKARKDPEATNHEKSVLHGNLSACFLKQKLGGRALEEAEKCVALDAQWYKGHLRVAKALTMIGKLDHATDAFFNSYNRIQEKEYSIKVSVLSELMDSWNDGKKEITDIALYLCLLQDPDAILELAVSYLKQNKWEHAQICHGVLMKCPLNSTGQHSMDLRPFCNSTKLLQANGEWIVNLLLIALKNNDHDHVKSLKFHEGDTYFHAFVNIYLLSNPSIDMLFDVFLRDIVKDKNICDARGNTVLHFLAQNKGGSQLLRKKLTFKLIEFGVDVKATNSDKKQAVDLCSKMDDLKLVFQHFIQTETVIERRKNVGSGSVSSRDQRQASSRPTSSVPKQSEATQNAQPSKEAPKAKRTEQSMPEKTANVSSQIKAPKFPEKFSKPLKPCDECEDLMREAAQYKKDGKESQMFVNLVNVVNKKHSDPHHSDLKKTCLERLVANLAIRNEDDIPKSLLEIGAAGCRELISLLTQRGRWMQIYHLVIAFRGKKGWDALKNFACQVSLLEFFTATSLAGKEDDRLKIFEFLMDSGGVLEDVTSAELVKCAMANMEFVVVLKLLERGADPSGVSFKTGDSPLHAALCVALEKDVGNFALFDKLTSTDQSGNKIYRGLDLKCQDNKGDNLLHLAAKAESTSHAVRIVEYLYKNQVPTNQKNKDGLLPVDCLPNAFDPRAAMLQEASPHATVGRSAYSQSSTGARPKTSSWISGGKDIQGLKEQMIKTLSKLQDYNFDLQEEVETDEDISSGEEEKDSSTDCENSSDACHSLSDDENDGNQEFDNNAETTVDANAFDNLPWEVECTEDVWNILKARKEKQTPQEKENTSKRKERITDNMKRIIVGKIQDLASGQWRASLTKRIRRRDSSLQLHYIKLPQGGYILWELAVAYSPRCSKPCDDSSADQDSGSRSGRIYSEIIRVWSISQNHSHLKSSIQKIRKSHQNGKNCVVKKNLKCLSEGQSSQTSTPTRFPKRYGETDITVCVSEEETPGDTTSLCPPASAGKTEYHILKFYSFSSNLVATILRNIAAKVEFPFKVTDKEHELINLQSKTPLLLIGRSGTGKTTVCLYRLWGKFLGYWEKVGNSDHRILPRVLPAISDQDEGEDDELKDEDDVKHVEEDSKEMKSNVASSSKDIRDEFELSFLNKESDPSPVESDASDDTEEDKEDDEEDDTTTRKSVQVEYHHLHQMFVTKNPKLCSEVKKSFNRLCQATDFTICQARDKDTPANTLDDIPDSAFPLFLTSRQLLILLDASVDGVPFFERDENLALKAVIPGWGTQKDIFHDIPLEVDSSDDESGGIAVASNHPSYHRSMSGPNRKVTGARPKHKHKPNRRECTYDVFAHEVWPSIKKKGCHPSLVWTEILSFIKGSYEALHTESGYLDEKQYLDIGRKRAPNFSGDRSEIYNIFRNYISYRRKHSLFDEADLVFNIYRRLSIMSYRPWVFHEIYVDEIQDFTQGELCLLINLSEDPNEMLLTGDTAQTIMRGISFRFEDLRSLFYYAQQSSTHCQKNRAAVKLPKGYEQLKYNYRSHTGILSLASAVLNLLAEFFKNSFDVLEPDQGMFPGPCPVVIENCKPGDLAFLLNGNRRKTSHIEFGAHQAILVVNDEAKESVPNELSSAIVLSIFESKGLEFDDILIYNFFKDSKAIEEWRVVTSYLNSLKTRSCDEQLANYGPVSLDFDILEGQGRPHPLSFDPNKHKVLNAELKQLYTAVTRARVNVWIFDEDLYKRAPMFEYFKALKLVSCMTYDDNGQADTDLNFVEESSPREWRKKGDVFMTQKLYEQAAKCYRKAGASEKLHLAQAHLAAQEASHMRENENVKPHEIKWAYFQAGVKFVHCGGLHYAAVCFLNAKETLLAAMAFEKNGEFEAAGHRYKDAMEFVKASICFRKCGLFHQAVKALADGKEYDKAIDCLHEYESKIKDLTDQGKEIPSVLRDNRPHASLSEINLLHSLMDEYDKKSYVKRLKSTIKRVSNVDEQVRCLCKYKFFLDAADILKNQGNFEEAVQLLMKEGYTNEAMDYAELSLSKSLCASVHLAISCRTYLKLQDLQKEEYDPPGKSETKKELLHNACSHSTSAKTLFKELGHKQGIAQTSLLAGMLKKDSALLNTAVREFQTCSPANPVGIIEAFKQFLITKESCDLDESEIKTAIKVIQIGKLIIETLWKPSSKNADMELAYLMSYELQLSHQREMVTWSANEEPLSLLTRQRFNHEKFKHSKEKSKAAFDICTSLEKDLIAWTELVEQSLNMCLSKSSPCPAFLQGIKCVNISCTYLHSFGRTKREIMFTLTILLHKVALERLTVDLLEKHEKEREEKWHSIRQLLDFLPPRSQRLALAPVYVMREVINKIRANSLVKDQMCRYFQFLWGNSGRVGTGKSRNLVKERAKESDWLIQTCLYERLFDLRIDVEEEAKKVEDELQKRGKEWLRKVNKYAIFAHWNDRGELICLESLGGRFINSFKLLTGSEKESPDLFEAFFPFTKLLGAFGKRGNPTLMPTIEHLLFWMEFYSTLSFCFIAKINTSKKGQQGHFFLPASYKSTIDMVDSCKQFNTTIEGDIMSHAFKQRHPVVMLFQRQKFMINLLCGDEQYSKISLIDCVMDLINGNPQDQISAERILVLAFVLLLNMELNYVDIKSQINLRRSLQKLTCPSGIPERLRSLIQSARNVANALEAADALGKFLSSCEDNLCLANWDREKTSPLQLHPLHLPQTARKKLMENFPEIPQQDSLYEHQETTDTANDGEVEKPDEEELERESQYRSQLRYQEERQKKAALIILRCLRLNLIKTRLKRKSFIDFERQLQFESFVMTDTYCGVCGCMVEDVSNVSEPSEDLDSYDNVTPVVSHEKSQGHAIKMADFTMFKEQYISQIHDNFRSFERFLQRHEVWKNPHIYANTNVSYLLEKFNSFVTMKNSTFALKSWKFIPLADCFNKLSVVFNDLYPTLTSCYEAYQEEMKQENAQAATVQGDARDMNYFDDDFLFSQSKKGKSNKQARNPDRRQYRKTQGKRNI